MVENDMGAEKFHKFVISFGGKTLHKAVAAAFVADSVNDFAAFADDAVTHDDAVFQNGALADAAAGEDGAVFLSLTISFSSFS